MQTSPNIYEDARVLRAIESQRNRDAAGPQVLPGLLNIELSAGHWRCSQAIPAQQAAAIIKAVEDGGIFSEPSACNAIYEDFSNGRHRDPRAESDMIMQAVTLAAKQGLGSWLMHGSRLSVEIIGNRAECSVESEKGRAVGRRPGPAPIKFAEPGTHNTAQIVIMPNGSDPSAHSDSFQIDRKDIEAARTRHLTKLNQGKISHRWGEVVASNLVLADGARNKITDLDVLADCIAWSLFAYSPASFADFGKGGMFLTIRLFPSGSPEEFNTEFIFEGRKVSHQ